MGLSDYNTAIAIRDAAAAEARRQIRNLVPQARWATVRSIDTATRSCMVVFNGETDAVRVPYSSVIPTREGQEVKVGGPVNDRMIEAVKGETQPETRLYTLEDGMDVRQVMASNYGIQNDYPVTKSVETDIPFNAPLWDSLNMPDPVNGAFLIPRFGYYDIDVKVGFDGGGMGNDFWCRAWLYCLPADGSARFVLAYDGFYFSQDSNAAPRMGEVSLSLNEMPHLFPGDRIVVAATTNVNAGGISGKVYANRTRIKIALRYGMERYYKPTT